jgi:predicted RNase H-like nuclease (RuvC/YqgF family)
MVEKYLNRKDDEDLDDKSHVTETGPTLEDTTDEIDPLQFTSRTIVFGKEIQNLPKDEIVKEKSEKFKDQMNNTNQYLKFINAHLEVNKSKVAKLKEAERRFKEEVAFLQDGQIKPRDELDSVNYKYITESDTKSLLTHLESEREILREKLSHQEEQIEKTRQQLQQKDEHITQVKTEIDTRFRKSVISNDDHIKTIKDELAKLGIKDDSAKILDAVNSLSDLLKQKK